MGMSNSVNAMQDFFKNILTYPKFLVLISAGVLSVLFKPVLPLLKNPVTAIALISVVISASIGTSLVLRAMLGLDAL
jgi:type II secretory pathway component PulF